MGAWAYCSNANCSHEFDKPSFAEILARKRKCPACGNVNYVSDDLGTALDEAFKDITELVTTKSQLVRVENRCTEADLPPTSPQARRPTPHRNFVGTLVYSAAGIAELHLPAGVTLPTGLYTVLLTKED